MKDVAVIGVGQTPYARSFSERTETLVFRTCREALATAGVDAADIDVVVVGAAPDGLTGQNCADKALVGAAAGVGKTFFRVNTGGSTGISAAYAAMDLIAAGRARTALVVGVERMAQAVDIPLVFSTIFDPIYERGLGLSTLSMGALRATRLMIRYGYTPELWAMVAVRNYKHAQRNPLAQMAPDLSVDDVLSAPMISWPIRKYDACPASEGVCAVVLASGVDLSAGAVPAWIAGRAGFTDTYNMGDRMNRPVGDLIDLATLRMATEKAYAQAGIGDPMVEVDLFEIHAPFTHAETMAYAPLQLCRPEDGPDLVAAGFGAEGKGPMVNPSGGPQAANPVGATALVRLAEAALQVQGRAGDRQVPGAMTAVCTGQGGANQFSTCTVVRAG